MLRMAMIAAAGLMAAAAPLAAAEVAVDSSITEIVVYPQGATVTRIVPFTLPAGSSVLVIDGLPAGIDAGSVRVEGSADAGLEVRSVEASEPQLKDDASPDRVALEDEITALRDRLAELGDRLTALQGQRSFIDNLVNAGPTGFGELLGQTGGGIDQWSAAWNMVREGLAAVQAEMRGVTLEQRTVSEDIAELERQLADLPPEIARFALRIEVEAAAPAEGSFRISYRVGSASWVPAYDATLTTGSAEEEPRLHLVRRAEITQQTGEDWTDAMMTLSTTRPGGGTAAPTLGANQLREGGGDDAFRLGGFASESLGVSGGAPPAPGQVSAQEQEAVADFGDFRADYIIPTPVTVTSGGGTRSVRLATEEMPARLFAQATPRLSEQAYLTAAFTASPDAPILSGAVNLFRDDAYVGTGRFGFTNPGEEVELGFGPDDQVRVTFTLQSREAGQQGLITRYDTDERHYLITVENRHSRSLEITVIDRQPYSEDERITVERLPETTPPTEEDLDGMRGVLAWTYEHAAGETREISNAYRASWPSDIFIGGIE